MGKRNKTKLSRAWTIWDDHDLGLKSLLDLNPPPPRPPVVLPYLPAEVSRWIANYLTRDSAKKLLITCKALRDAGEMKLWRFNEIGVPKIECYSHQHGFMFTRYTDRVLSENLATAKRFSDTIRSYPIRLDSLVMLGLGIYAGPSGIMESTLLELTAICAPKLQFLSLTCRPVEKCAHDSANDPRLSPLGYLEKLSRRSNSFPKLTAFKIQLSSEAGQYKALAKLLQSFTGIRDLVVALWGPEKTSCVPCCQEITAWAALPTLDKIRFLEIEGVSDHHYASCLIAGNLISACSKARAISLSGYWLPGNPSITPIFETMAAHDADSVTLHNGSWSQTSSLVIRFPRVSNGNTKRLILKGVDGIAKEADLGLEDMLYDLSSPAEEILLLPGNPVERFDSIPDKSERTIDIPSQQSLVDRAPNLKVIRLATVAEHQNWPCTIERLNESTSWNKSGTIGTLIRSFTHPDRGEYLFHLRQLRWTDLDPGPKSSGKAREWTSGVMYRGREVPEWYWKEAYKLAGLKYPWTKGARRVTMPEAGWEILEKWYQFESVRFGGMFD